MPLGDAVISTTSWGSHLGAPQGTGAGLNAIEGTWYLLYVPLTPYIGQMRLSDIYLLCSHQPMDEDQLTHVPLM